MYYKKVHPKFKFRIHRGFYLSIHNWFVFGIDIQDDDEDDRWAISFGKKAISIGLGKINPYFTWLRPKKNIKKLDNFPKYEIPPLIIDEDIEYRFLENKEQYK